MKHIIVTCATSGIGEAIAQHLATEGYNLMLLGRNQSKLSCLQKKITETTKSNIKICSIDYADTATINNFQTCLMNSKIDVAGIVIITPRPMPSEKNLPEKEYWDALFNICFTTPLEVLKRVMPHLKQKSKIVIISGISSLQAINNHSSAFAVLRMMWLAQAKSLANELGPQSICVNTLSPGGVLTDKAKQKIEKKAQLNNKTYEEQYQDSVSNVPLRKYAEPKEVATMVEFLLSEKSSHLTGVNLPCDGGFIQSY